MAAVRHRYMNQWVASPGATLRAHQHRQEHIIIRIIIADPFAENQLIFKMAATADTFLYLSGLPLAVQCNLNELHKKFL